MEPNTTSTTAVKVSHHPLHQIAESPTHKLLLKHWLKEEDLISRRAALKESQIAAVRRELTFLHAFFFVFHSVALLLLFSTTATATPNHSSSAAATNTCRRSWVPCLVSLACSMAIIWAIRYKTDLEAHMVRLLEREEEDGGLLGRCVAELRKKGVEFDLLKEVDALRRAKSLTVEAKSAAAGGSAVRRWSEMDFATVSLVAASCLVVALTRFVLCG